MQSDTTDRDIYSASTCSFCRLSFLDVSQTGWVSSAASCSWRVLGGKRLFFFLNILCVCLIHHLRSTYGKTDVRSFRSRLLVSVRLAIQGTTDTGDQIHAAQLIVRPVLEEEGKIHRERHAALVNFPAGNYNVSERLTSTCFNEEILHLDLPNRSSVRLDGSCMSKSTRKERSYRMKHTSMNTVNNSELCKTFNEAFNTGFWVNEKDWQPSQCRVITSSLQALQTALVVHIAGDSVLRNMFGNLCTKVAATKSAQFRESGKLVRQHCCSEDNMVCLTHRMSWFPRESFFPQHYHEQYSSRTEYCLGASNISACMLETPKILFPNETKLEEVEVWHWLFYGSHSDLLGASYDTCQRLREISVQGGKMLLFGTPSIKENLIPTKYASQRVSRTNARISALNDLLPSCVGHEVAVNMFVPTHALPEVNFADAIHLDASANGVLASAIMTTFSHVRGMLRSSSNIVLQ